MYHVLNMSRLELLSSIVVNIYLIVSATADIGALQEQSQNTSEKLRYINMNLTLDIILILNLNPNLNPKPNIKLNVSTAINFYLIPEPLNP
jgi:hypothetical protein